MKKNIAMTILMISIIFAGCQLKPETLGINEVDQISSRLEEVINPNLKLQIANDDKNTYIVLHTTGDSTASVLAEENIASVRLNINEQTGGQINQYVYELTLSPEQDTIDVSINGERTHFDSSIGF